MATSKEQKAAIAPLGKCRFCGSAKRLVGDTVVCPCQMAEIIDKHPKVSNNAK